MKKLKCMLLAVVLLLISTNASAMTESELKAKLTKAYTIDGETVQVTASQVAELERYLKEYEISSEDADYIATKFDEALKIAQDGKAKSYTELTTAEKQKMVSIVSDVSKETSVKVTLSEGGLLTVFEEDGKTPFTVIKDKDNGIQNTNSSYTLVIIASAITLLGAAVITKKVAKANA